MTSSTQQQLDGTNAMMMMMDQKETPPQSESAPVVVPELPGPTETTANNATATTTATAAVTNSPLVMAAASSMGKLQRPNHKSIKLPTTRKKRKATTVVLAVGASRETDRSVATTTTTNGESVTTNNTQFPVTDSNRSLQQQQQPPPPTDQQQQQQQQQQLLRTIHNNNNHHHSSGHYRPLELIPPVIPENTTGKPSLRMFCTSYPKPKKPRRTTTPSRSASGTIVATTTTTTDLTTATNGLPTTTAEEATTTTTMDPPPDHRILTTTMTTTNESLPHAGPVVQIVNGEIVLQESSMVFHGAVGGPGSFMSGGGGTTADADNNYATGLSFAADGNPTMTVVEEEAEMAVVGATYTSFATGRRARPKVSHWTVEETQLFYEALQQVGLDFGTMEAYFEAAALNSHNSNGNIRIRQRRQLKRKYQAEYNKNPKLIEKALQCQGRVGIDLSIFHLSDDVVHDTNNDNDDDDDNNNVHESSESQRNDIPDTDGATLDERNDTDTTCHTTNLESDHHDDDDHQNLKESTTTTTNDEPDTNVVVEADATSVTSAEDLLPAVPVTSPTSVGRSKVPPLTTTTSNSRNHPPNIARKSKTIRPLRSAAARTVKQNQSKK